LQRLEHRLAQKQKDQEQGKVRLCFGSKKLFHAQFHLKESGYRSHEEWKRAFQEKRDSGFILVGSKDESTGNQSCQAMLGGNGAISLHIRLPNPLVQGNKKHITVSCVPFSYGQEEICEALKSCMQRNAMQRGQDPSFCYYGQALTYRFKKDESVCTRKEKGVIGIDINADHLAVTETDAHGNPIRTQSIPLHTYGKSKAQAEALIGDVAKQITAHAERAQKSIVVEELDFSRKKKELADNYNPSYARMLSSFSYRKITTMIRSRSHRFGVEVLSVHPAYTSLIGKTKYAIRYGLTIHTAAALCIARRGLGFLEKQPRQLGHIPTGKGDYVTLTQPVRNRVEHSKSFWKALSQELKAGHGVRSQTTKKSIRQTAFCLSG